jgi:hypothetical protein
MDADLGRTSSGRLCKKCEKKGERCRQHSSSSSTSLTFENLLDLPKPALQNILLRLELKELKQLCSEYKKIHSICILSEFQRLYDIRHKTNSFTIGKKRVSETNLVITGKDGIKMIISFTEKDEDSNDNLIIHVFSIKTKESVNFIYDFLDSETWFQIGEPEEDNIRGFLWIKRNEGWFTAIDNVRTKKDESKILDFLQNILTSRNKLEWMPYFDEKGIIRINKNFPQELFETAKTALAKNGIECNIVWR